MSEINNNQNTELEPEPQNTENLSEQSEESGQYYSGQPYNAYPQYDNPQQGYDNGQYYNSQQYYGQNQGYNNQQYYGQEQGYNNQQYYGQNQSYNNGQYYGQQGAGYHNQQYYDQNAGQNSGYNNGQYYGQNAGYNNQQYYGQNAGYNNGQYYGQNAGYNNQQYYDPGYGQQPYANPQSAYRPAEPVREPVSNVFFYILMALTAASTLIALVAAKGLITNIFSTIDFDSAVGQDFSSMYSSMMYSFANAPGYSAYSVLNSLLGFAILAVSIVDIVLVHKKGYPILGMILFTILFKPGYFIWRAHVVKQKKTIPVLFTVCYVLLYMVYFFWCFYYMLSLVA